MENRLKGWISFALAFLVLGSVTDNGLCTEPSPALFQQHCAQCHRHDRMDLAKPALRRHSSADPTTTDLQTVVRSHPAHTAALDKHIENLSPIDLRSLVDFSSAPLAPAPHWNPQDIRSSRSALIEPSSLNESPQFTANPLNLSLVVESGGDHVTILSSDKLETVARIRFRSALTGSPQFTPDGRYAFLTTFDGWVSKLDIWNLKVVTEVRVGLHTRNAAISGNGKYVAVANYQPQTLAMLDADLNLLKVLPVTDKEGKRASRVLSVHTAAPRQSFVAVLKDVQEVWEVSYNPLAPEIPLGVIHDFQYREGAFAPGFLNPIRTVLNHNLDDFAFSSDRNELIATAVARGQQHIINLDVRRKIEEWTSAGRTRLGSSYYWKQRQQNVMAAPSETDSYLNLIDMQQGTSLARLPLPGPAQTIRSHEGSRHLWVVSSTQQPNTSALTIIEKDSLKAVAELRPAPGKKLSHIGFSRDGSYLLASVAGTDGSVIAYDTRNLQEVKRIPMNRPIGIYNVRNSIASTQEDLPFATMPWCDHCTP